MRFIRHLRPPNPAAWLKRQAVAVAALFCFATNLHAEEVRLYDNSRIFGLVQAVSPSGELVIRQPTGEDVNVRLEEVISIQFLGRSPLLIQSGTQEFRFLSGGRLRGLILGCEGNRLFVQTAMTGEISIDLAHLKGFVALPLAGFSGRKAEELVESTPPGLSAALDVVLDRRGSTYPGVVRNFATTELALDHEELLQVVPVKMLYVSGVRLADATRTPPKPWDGEVRVRLVGRDRSEIEGTLDRVHLGKWHLRPAWDPNATLEIAVDEISLVQVLGGRVQYLSQLTPPVEVSEQTVLAPAQPYRMDQSCQGDTLSIAGKRYPWGIGMHADCRLTFSLKGRFQRFQSEVGIATRMGTRGSVVFTVAGDGKKIFDSGVVRGGEESPREIDIPVAGVEQLTISVTNAGDLDLSDVANWGSARVSR